MISVLEFEQEPIKGIPGLLPASEAILWQGAPSWRSLLFHVLHVRWIWAYFGAIIALRFYSHIASGNGLEMAASSAAWLAVLGLIVTALMGGFAFLIKRSTVYTITSKRVILRYGVVVPMAVNVPFAKIETADLKRFADGTGEIPLSVSGPEQFAYAMMWPHVRRWRFLEPQPMLRSVPDAVKVAGLLSTAIAAAIAENPVASEASRPVRVPSRAGTAVASPAASPASSVPQPA